MSQVDFEDDDVDALLDMCWTDKSLADPESPCTGPKVEYDDGYNGVSTLSGDSFVHIREIGCDFSTSISMPVLPHGFGKPAQPENPAAVYSDPLGEMKDVAQHSSQPDIRSSSAVSLSRAVGQGLTLLDLPFDLDAPIVVRSPKPAEIPTKPVEVYQTLPIESQKQVQRPVCTDRFGEGLPENHVSQQPAPQVAVSHRPEYPRQGYLPREDSALVTTLLNPSQHMDDLETLEEAIIEETQRIREIERVLESRKARREQLRRDYAMALVRSVSCSEPTPISFTMVVTRSHGRPNIGLVVGYDEEKGHLTVTSVKSEGLVPQANEERAIRNLPIVEVGDSLISINGVSGDKYMMTRQLVEGPMTIQLVFVKTK